MLRSYKSISYILISCFLISSYGCFPWVRKAQVTPKDTLKNQKLISKSKAESIRDLESLYSNMNSLEARTSVDINLGEFNQEVNSQIRWIRDSVFWMNFTVLGIEGARLLITKDSLFLIDRINKEYYTNSLERMSTQYNIPFNFKSVEAFLLGYPVFLSEEEIKEDAATPGRHFTLEDKQWLAEYYTDSTMTQLNKMLIKQNGGESRLSNTLDNFKPQKGYHKFSYNRVLDLYTRQIGKGYIKLEINDLEINTPKEIKFSIPSSYERM